ncbi:MAG: Eco47II family restriction endonuclease [Candidatus Woesearchaeota archaeon]
MPNKYVDFVSDKDFLECVKWVCEAYPQINDVNEVNMKSLTKNALDPVKMVFDIFNGEIDFNQWIKNEQIRQADKTVTNRIGEFHQRLLGKVAGWEDLGRGDPLGIDLKKSDNTIFIELKNKHNTVKGEDQKHVFDKLKRVSKQNPSSKIYYAYILPKKPSSGERVWNPSQRSSKVNILEAWGGRVYEIVTQKSDSLEQVYKALPIAIATVLQNKRKITRFEKQKLKELFDLSLGTQ